MKSSDGHSAFGAADAHVHAQQAADDHQRVAHVVARVAEVGVADLVDRLVACSRMVITSASICVG